MRLLQQGFLFPALIFGFYALILVAPDSYEVFAAALVLLALAVIVFVRPRLVCGLDLWFVGFLALYPFSLLPSFAVRGGVFDYLDYPIRCLLCIPLVVGLRVHSAREWVEKSLFMGASVGGIGAGLFSLKSLLLDHVGRVGLPLTNPIAYGQVAAILAILALASFLRFDRVWCRSLSAVGFLGAVYAVYGSGSAGALLGLAFGLGGELVVFLGSSFSGRQKSLVLALVAAAVAIVIPLASFKLAQVLSDFHAYSLGHGMGTSQGQRLLLWGMALREIAHSPWLGIGPGNFDGVMHHYCLENLCNEDFRGFRGVHNQYLDSFMNGGVVALLGLLASFLLPLALFLRCAWKSERFASLSALAGFAVIVAAMVSALSQISYGHNISVFSYFYTISILWIVATPCCDRMPLKL